MSSASESASMTFKTKLEIEFTDGDKKIIKSNGTNAVVAASDDTDPGCTWDVTLDSNLATVQIKDNLGNYLYINAGDAGVSPNTNLLTCTNPVGSTNEYFIYNAIPNGNLYLTMEDTTLDAPVQVNTDVNEDPPKKKWKFRKSLGQVEL